MAQIYPDPISPGTKSFGEQDLYRLFKDKLDDVFVVIHSAAWIAHDPRTGARDGETDFVVAHPSHGVLVIEVKGGEIRLDQKSQTWTSTNRGGTTYDIKDPFAQARDGRYSLSEKLRHAQHTRHYDWPVFYAVAFPEVSLSNDLRPDAPRDIIIDLTRLDNLQDTIYAVFEYWKGQEGRDRSPGQQGIKELVRLLAPEWKPSAPVALALRRDGKEIDQLTERQFMALDLLKRYRRSAIVGGAGTGKTMLAIEKAHRLATEGFDVLFVCFNRNLADWLGKTIGDDEHILATTFHGLCGQAVHWAGIPMPPRAEGEDFYGETLPNALVEAVDNMDRRFDAIIVDEGQDFRESWWLPLDALLKDEDGGIFYVFFDDNQNIFNEISSIPIEGEPFVLDKNCRNTQGIHDALGPYSHARYPTTCLGPEGRPVEIIPVAEEDASKVLRDALLRLVDDWGFRPADIIVLTPRSDETSRWQQGQKMGTLSLTWALETELTKAVCVSTIHSFKGLERPIVVLTEMEAAKSDEVVYVALSRARLHAVVIGNLPQPQSKGRQ